MLFTEGSMMSGGSHIAELLSFFTSFVKESSPDYYRFTTSSFSTHFC